MRKLFTQQEVIRAAELLGIKPFTRQKIWYWEKQGVFPKPYSQLRGSIAWYRRENVILGLLNISIRLVKAKKLDQDNNLVWEDVDNVLEIVAKSHPKVTRELSKLNQDKAIAKSEVKKEVLKAFVKLNDIDKSEAEQYQIWMEYIKNNLNK